MSCVWTHQCLVDVLILFTWAAAGKGKGISAQDSDIAMPTTTFDTAGVVTLGDGDGDGLIRELCLDSPMPCRCPDLVYVGSRWY